jgi:hypothetical protein
MHVNKINEMNLHLDYKIIVCSLIIIATSTVISEDNNYLVSDQSIGVEAFGAMINESMLPPNEATMGKISIYRIAANPSEFHGQIIKTSEVLGHALDMPYLGYYEVYFSTTDYHERVVKNCLLVRVNDKYRSIIEEKQTGVRFTFVGTFYAPRHPLHPGSGYVTDLVWVDFGFYE